MDACGRSRPEPGPCPQQHGAHSPERMSVAELHPSSQPGWQWVVPMGQASC